MDSSFGLVNKGKRRDSNARAGSAEQKLAVESVRNVANWGVHEKTGESAADTDRELAAIVSVLRNAGTSLAVAEVAKQLQWDSEKTANALARGGEFGVLGFSRDGDWTTVALKKA
ncbi:MAG: hypothetical protein P8Y71_22060 [Pseudolabrys sp.]